MRIISTEQEVAELIKRRSVSFSPEISEQVAAIIEQVRHGGDQALIELSKRLDSADFETSAEITIEKEQLESVACELAQEHQKLYQALKLAAQNIKDFHLWQKEKITGATTTENHIYKSCNAIEVMEIWHPIERVGVYAPAGTASYPSSVLMSAIPASVAGVEEIILATPYNASFASSLGINPAILMAAYICGISKIHRLGGAIAVAAMAIGTKSITNVNKIVGPGNQYLAKAKQLLFGEVGIDMIAGPTDVLILAGAVADIEQPRLAKLIASDLIAQAEHGVDSAAILLTDNVELAYMVNSEIARIAAETIRHDIVEQSLDSFGYIVILEDLVSNGTKLANLIAPEHLEIIDDRETEILEKIRHAGAIFLGAYTPEVLGDYIAGPSHTLPTMRSARFSSGLSVYDFLTRKSVIKASMAGFARLADATITLAESEGLMAHANSIKIRL